MNDNENLDIENYTINDILSIFNIVNPTINNVTDIANTLIARMTVEKKTDMALFITSARDKVLSYLQNIEEEDIEIENTEYIDKLWNTTTVDDSLKKNPVIFFNDQSRSIAEQKQESIKTGTPVFSTYIVSIDSQYRTNILPYENNRLSNAFNTQFTFSLTNPIPNVTSITLYSYQIPTSWYAFSLQLGNTFFIYNGVILNIPDGNYTPATIVEKINTVANQNIATAGLLAEYDIELNRISFTNTDTLLDTVSAIFFLQSNVVSYSNCTSFILSNFRTLSINSTLGWLLGFRTQFDTNGDVVLSLEPNKKVYADVSPDTYGPKYFVLSLEDYKNQRLTRGIYGITNSKTYGTISIPNYYKTIHVACKLREGSLTQAEQYAINAVTESSESSVNDDTFNRLNNRPIGAAFAIIPLHDIKNLRPDPYVRFGGDLVFHKRNYIAPTNLERFNVSLTDDKGNLVNLYDNDWSFSIIVESQIN
jgi:hypothetical protein